MRRPASIAVLLCLTVAVAALVALVWRSASSRNVQRPRVTPSRQVAGTFMDVVCRRPSDTETLFWNGRPFNRAEIEQTLSDAGEAEAVSRVRSAYYELLRRKSTLDDCAAIRNWMDRGVELDIVRRELAAQPEARRVEGVRRVFIDALGRDPREWDDPALRRWVNSPYTLTEIRARLLAQRPLVGVHYFMWYRSTTGWGNRLTSVAEDAPRPLVGPYDSSDTDVIATQIRQVEDAGFDFALVHIVFNEPRTWTNARTFIDRLSGHRLKAVIVLDGLYQEDPAVKAMWVQKVKDEYAGDSHYLQLYGQPLIVLFSALTDFDVPGVLLRNLYFTSRYDPGQNTFNPSRRLEPRDWAFWAPTPQPLVNGMVPVIPGYNDAPLDRPRTMVYPRENGRYYKEQYRRALTLRPELILVYGWNEYFEQTAIEPTNVWAQQYLDLSACLNAHAHRGTWGEC